MRSLHDVNLNALRSVECAARAGSFSAAADELLVTPSAVSQQVKKLEAQLNFKLFNRRNNSVILTTEGDIFIAQVRQALDTILNASLELTSFDRQTVLKINALPTFFVRWLMIRLKRFEAIAPDVRLNLAGSYPPPNFSREDVDLAIRYGNGDFPGLESRLLFGEELTPVCAPSLIAEKFGHGVGAIMPSDLAGFTLLHSNTCTMNWQYWLEETRAQDVLKEASSTYFDSCLLSYEAATAGLGFAIANCSYMVEDIAAGKLVAPFRAYLKSGCGWYIVYPPSHAELPRVKSFEDWIVHEAMQSQERVSEVFAH